MPLWIFLLPRIRTRPKIEIGGGIVTKSVIFLPDAFQNAEFNGYAHCRINSFKGAMVAATRRAVVCTVPYGSSSLPMAT